MSMKISEALRLNFGPAQRKLIQRLGLGVYNIGTVIANSGEERQIIVRTNLGMWIMNSGTAIEYYGR